VPGVAGEIWWGDVIRASRALGTRSEADFTALARLLGFGRPAAPVPAADRAPEPSTPDGPGAAGAGEAGDEPVPPQARGGPGAGHPVQGVLLAPVATQPLGPRLGEGSVLARPAQTRPVLPHRSLLAPRSTAAILQYLLSREVADGPVDLSAAIETIAAGRPLRALPRQARRTLRFGTQILVDLGEGMRPFRRDQVEVIDAVHAVVGREATTVRYFAGAPLRPAGAGRRRPWRLYSPPAPGSTVLILSDLGIGGDRLLLERATVAEWAAFLRLVHRARCAPVALVPYPPSRWPRALRPLCPMLTWDRHVTVGHARAALR
jgi:hypothetical protein